MKNNEMVQDYSFCSFLLLKNNQKSAKHTEQKKKDQKKMRDDNNDLNRGWKPKKKRKTLMNIKNKNFIQFKNKKRNGNTDTSFH